MKENVEVKVWFQLTWLLKSGQKKGEQWWVYREQKHVHELQARLVDVSPELRWNEHSRVMSTTRGHAFLAFDARGVNAVVDGILCTNDDLTMRTTLNLTELTEPPSDALTFSLDAEEELLEPRHPQQGSVESLGMRSEPCRHTDARSLHLPTPFECRYSCSFPKRLPGWFRVRGTLAWKGKVIAKGVSESFMMYNPRITNRAHLKDYTPQEIRFMETYAATPGRVVEEWIQLGRSIGLQEGRPQHLVEVAQEFFKLSNKRVARRSTNYLEMPPLKRLRTDQLQALPHPGGIGLAAGMRAEGLPMGLQGMGVGGVGMRAPDVRLAAIGAVGRPAVRGGGGGSLGVGEGRGRRVAGMGAPAAVGSSGQIRVKRQSPTWEGYFDEKRSGREKERQPRRAVLFQWLEPSGKALVSPCFSSVYVQQSTSLEELRNMILAKSKRLIHTQFKRGREWKAKHLYCKFNDVVAEILDGADVGNLLLQTDSPKILASPSHAPPDPMLFRSEPKWTSGGGAHQLTLAGQVATSAIGQAHSYSPLSPPPPASREEDPAFTVDGGGGRIREVYADAATLQDLMEAISQVFDEPVEMIDSVTKKATGAEIVSDKNVERLRVTDVLVVAWKSDGE